MKEWKCGICGHIHEEQEPPEQCPVCKAKKENFSQTQKEAAQWRCTICGHIHEGAEAPESCPLCKSPKEKFEALPGPAGGPAEKSAEPPAAQAQSAKKEETTKSVEVKPEPANYVVAASPAKPANGKRWRCLVCGHVHESETPPAQCPICKAPASQFVELDAKGNPIKKDGAAAPMAKPSIIARILLGLHVHPILTHFPNGILPMVVLFMAGSVFLGYDIFVEKSTFFSLIFVLVTMPFVIASGFLEWKKRYRGARTVLFATKIFCSFLALTCLAALVAWYAFDPEVMLPDSPYRLIYFIVAAILLLAVILAGHLGGRLVFKNRGR